MRPGSGHGLGNFAGVEVCENLLNPPQLCDCVDFVSSQRVDQLLFVILEAALANTTKEDGSDGMRDKVHST